MPDALAQVRAEVDGPPQVAPPQITRAGAGYIAKFPLAGIAMRLRHLKVSSGETRASLTVSSIPRTAGAPFGHLYHGTFNLSGLSSRSTLAKYLRERWEADWPSILEQLCLNVLRLEEEGEPAILLRDAARPDEAGSLLGSLCLARHPVIWFGDGGTAKSYLALAAALSIHAGVDLLGIPPAAQKRVAYLDWEFDGWEHKQRMKRLLGGDLPDESLPDIVYVRCVKPLAREVDRISHIFADNSVGYAVVDSIAWACDGPPEEAAAATGFFEALRSLNVGSLCVAHMNRMGDTERPFGSVFWHNGARATWFVKKQQENGGDSLDVGLFNRKTNSGRLEVPLGYTLRFSEEHTQILRTDVRDIPGLAEQTSLKARISRLLAVSGARSQKDIADELSVELNSVVQTVRRHEGRSFVRLDDGRIGLVGPEEA